MQLSTVKHAFDYRELLDGTESAFTIIDILVSQELQRPFANMAPPRFSYLSADVGECFLHLMQ